MSARFGYICCVEKAFHVVKLWDRLFAQQAFNSIWLYSHGLSKEAINKNIVRNEGTLTKVLLVIVQMYTDFYKDIMFCFPLKLILECTSILFFMRVTTYLLFIWSTGSRN